MPTLNAPQSATYVTASPQEFVNVICTGAADVMLVSWVGPAGTSGQRTVRNTTSAGEDIGPLLDGTTVTFLAQAGAPVYSAPAFSPPVQSLVSGAGIPASLRFCIPGRNPNTLFSDVSGLGADLAVEPANSGAFATADYFSSIGGTDSGLTIAAAKTLWTPATQSIVLAFVIKKAAPGANQNVLSWGGHVSGANIGFYVSHRTSGALKIVPVVAGATLNPQPDSTLSFSDGTPQDRHCLIAYDAPSGSWYMYRDGVLSNAWTNTMAGANAFPAATPTITGVRWGGTSGTGATVVAASGYGLQGYLWDGPLPTKVGALAQLLAANLSATARAPASQLIA